MAWWNRESPPVIGVAHAATNRQIDQKSPVTAAWQGEAWRVWETLGEIHYPTTQIARLISRLDWNCDPDFDLESEFENPGLAEVSRVTALNLIVSGEAWLTKTGDAWTVYSTSTPNLNAVLRATEIKIRVWTPDPRDPEKADSGVRAALGPATELVTLQNLSLAQDRSRAASVGLLLRPATRQPLLDDEGNPVDFNEMLHESLTSAIQDPTSTSAVVPIDLELPQDEIEAWTFLQFGRPYDENIDRRMERVIRRIALALDIWPELLLGVADINHWGSWFLSEDTWRSSTAPLANQVAQAFELAVLEATGRDVSIEPDPAVLLARRSSVRDALNAAWIGAIGLPYLREVIGAEETDKPSPEDLEIVRLMAGQRRSESRAGITTEDDAPKVPDSGDQDSIQAALPAGDFDPVDRYAALGVELVRVDDQLSAWLEGAAETVVDRARGAVGVRLRRAVRGLELEREVDLVAHTDVAAVLGEQAFDLVDVDQVVDALVEPLVERWEARLDLARARTGDLVGDLGVDMDDGVWMDARKRSSEILFDLVKNHVVATLTETSPPLLDLRPVVAAAGLD